ncbi:MAG: MBL fold metallo-hydrolase [Ruminococcus sp.]|nr:MBL fold metallo-hydrolase [Ruminococcus sp.]
MSDNISANNAELTISFIDVGQGDATLIECDNEAMLIDAGLYSERQAVTSYIYKRGIRSLDYCVATHPHADHIGGMSDVIYSLDVDTLVYPLCDTESSSWNYVLDACDETGVSYFNPEPLDTIKLGKATITFLSPERNAVYDDLNNYSLVLKLEYENVSFLFTGDAEKQVETKLLETHFDLSADVLKCGHHGSSTSSSEAFINAVNPAAAVISCGIDNEYGHPHRETLNTLNDRGIKIYRTDMSSTIVALSDGETITFCSGDEVLGEVAVNTQSETQSASSEAAYNYVGNKNSKVFHSLNCSSVENTKEKNKVYFNTREDAADNGYSPCKACNP